KLEAIKRMKIATTLDGSSVNSTFRVLLQMYGINPDTDVILAPSGDLNNLVLMAKAGRADGYFVGPPLTTLAVEQGWGQVWVNPIDQIEVKLLDKAVQAVIIAKRPTLTTKREELKRFVSALRVAFKDIHERSDLVRDTIRSKFFADVDPRIFAVAYEKSRKLYDHDMVATTEGYEQLLSTIEITDPEGKKASIAYDRAFDFSILK